MPEPSRNNGSLKKITFYFSLILPGILVAATGVGAGDLAVASLTGSRLGVSVLWAVVLGGFMKYILNEGLARWQLVTGTTFLEGVRCYFGKVAGWLFLPYLMLWSFFVGSALMGACGVTLFAIWPVFPDPSQGKIVFGMLCSLAGLIMVKAGGFMLFEKIMAGCIGLMFVTVLYTAVTLWPGTADVMAGLLCPSIPYGEGSGLTWTVALIGGVGGTLTILCYGYWIEESGRRGPDWIKGCRIDLGAGYIMTVVFGLSMVIIGSTIEVDGKGAGLLVALSSALERNVSPAVSRLFLAGAFGAVFSSLLGVWQAVPYLFSDIWRLFIVKNTDRSVAVDDTPAYRNFMMILAVVPMAGLFLSFKEVQKLYGVIGAAFFPLLAVALLLMNGNKKAAGSFRNRPLAIISLILIILFFMWAAILSIF